MIDLTVSELLMLTEDLPTPQDFNGDYIMVCVRERYRDILIRPIKECNIKCRVAEFKKTMDGREWVLVRVS